MHRDSRLIRLVRGIAIPGYMGFLLDMCVPTGYTREAVDAGDLLKIDYHPPYVEFECRDPERVVDEARRRRLRVYRGKHHITVSDGVYRARIYISRSPKPKRY